MYQSSGVEPLWTAAGVPISYTLLAQAGREFQICLKCHSTYTTLPTYSPDGYGWNGSSPTIGYIPNGLGKLTSTNPAQIRDSRDMATEFNSFQVSFHPVAAQGRNSNMPAGSFVAPWSQDSILFCSDCHDNADGSDRRPTRLAPACTFWMARRNTSPRPIPRAARRVAVHRSTPRVNCASNVTNTARMPQAPTRSQLLDLGTAWKTCTLSTALAPAMPATTRTAANKIT